MPAHPTRGKQPASPAHHEKLHSFAPGPLRISAGRASGSSMWTQRLAPTRASRKFPTGHCTQSDRSPTSSANMTIWHWMYPTGLARTIGRCVSGRWVPHRRVSTARGSDRDGARCLRKQLVKRPTGVFIFRGEPILQVSTKAWATALKRAGIEDFKRHDLRLAACGLRHTSATWQRQAGTPTHELQRLGGWKTGSMVERDAHAAPEALQGVENRLERSAATLWLRQKDQRPRRIV